MILEEEIRDVTSAPELAHYRDPLRSAFANQKVAGSPIWILTAAVTAHASQIARERATGERTSDAISKIICDGLDQGREAFGPALLELLVIVLLARWQRAFATCGYCGAYHALVACPAVRAQLEVGRRVYAQQLSDLRLGGDGAREN